MVYPCIFASIKYPSLSYVSSIYGSVTPDAGTLTVTGLYALPSGAVVTPFSVIVIGSTVILGVTGVPSHSIHLLFSLSYL